MPSSFIEEQRHFYNRSYVTVNSTPDDYSPFPYSAHAAVPRFNSRLDDYASRFSGSKLSPTPLSDDGYNSSSASSTFAPFNSRRDDLDRAHSRLSSSTNGESAQPTRVDWANVEIVSKNGARPVEILKTTDRNPSHALHGKHPQPSVKFVSEFGDKGSRKGAPNGEQVDGQGLKNVKMSIAEIEGRERQEREKAQAALMPDITVHPATPLDEDKMRASDGFIRLQSGTNQHESQKGMTSFGTMRRERTKVSSNGSKFDSEHPDQSEIPLQSGTNKFASQKGMTSFGTLRRERTKVDDAFDSEHPDQSEIRLQSGTNKFASQKGMTGFGQPRWEVLNPEIAQSDGRSDTLVRLQSGSNQFASQAGGPSFGTARDPHGRHMKRLWEQYYPNESKTL